MSQREFEDSFYPRIPPPRSIGESSRQSMLELEYVERTDVGRVRDHNEDYLGHAAPATPAQARTHGWLFVLADGVGGHEQGEVASQAAVESMIAGFQKARDGEAHSALLPRLVQQANTHVLETAHAGGPSAAGMATTMVACALRFDRVTVAHVGDSRCYLIRNAQAVQITRDHTVANEQIRLGLVSAQRGRGRFDAAHSQPFARNRADCKCGDQRSSGIPGGRSSPVLRWLAWLGGRFGNGRAYAATAWTCMPRLKNWLRLPTSRGGTDNISVQLVRIRDVERMGMYRGRPYKLY